ncbi:MAG: hypothetical protein QOF02_4131 [Blastocatellia bacterium]|jgi:hypothetical protein|nr:hypothetical protein [Blastocatellia bacterium]
MKFNGKALVRSLLYVAVVCACLGAGGSLRALAQDGNMSGGATKTDPRKLTTIQTASADVGKNKKAVEVRYLNLPFGAPTFGYMEVGGDRYYSNRTWPILHLTLTQNAMYDGKALAPGDYVFYITPKSEQLKTTSMMLTLASFKPATAGGTFLVPGDVFTETPKDAIVISQKAVTFGKGAEVAPALQVWVGTEGKGKDVDIKLHYGDRTLTEKLTLK